MDVLSRARNRPNFGNGGEVENLLGKAKNNYQSRQADLPVAKRALDIVFQPVDFDPNFNRSADSDKNLEELFAGVIGCSEVIDKLREYQNIAKIVKQRGQDVREHVPTTFQFKGPPGIVALLLTHWVLTKISFDYRYRKNNDGEKNGPSLLRYGLPVINGGHRMLRI